MRKIILITISTFVISGAVLFTARTDTQANASGAPAYETGSPADGGNCTDCHGGTAAAGGTITSNIPASGYVAGTTYNFTVSVSGSASNNYGFELTCENTAGAFLGTLSTPGTGAKLISTSHFVTHSTPGTGTSKSWTLSWTAPSASPPATVTFYAAFLVGNNNGSNSGDATKTTTKTYSLSTPCTMSGGLISQTNVSCNGGNNGAATVSASGGTGTLTYSWVPSGGAAATASGLSAGTYTCTIRDAGTCSTTQAVTITQPSVLTASVASKTNVSCNGNNNGAVTVSVAGGTGPYTYNWAPSGGTAASAINLVAGNYTCTVSDAHGCAKTQSVSLTQPAAIVTAITSQTNVACGASNNGAATISATGGAGSFTYNWMPSGGTGTTATGLSVGTYTCMVTDAGGCTKAQAVNITQPANGISSGIASQSNVSCNGMTNGAATVSASGGAGSLSYNWSPSGGTSPSVNGLAAGTYTCIISDANSCTKTQTVLITQPGALAVSASQVDIGCNNTSGQAQVSVSGGTAPYAYIWSPVGGTSATATNLQAGNYTCNITDAMSCSIIQGFTITSSSTPPVVSIYSTGSSICNGQTVTLIASGANSYTWSNGATTGAITVNPSATSSYSVTGSTGCTGTASATVTVNQLPSVSAAAAMPIICEGQTTTITASGATTYAWSNSSTGASIVISPSSNTTYTVVGTDANNCNNQAVVTQSVSVCTGIGQPAAQVALRLYPNPNQGPFTLELGVTTQVTVSNVFGDIILNEILGQGMHQLDMSDKARGLYFVKAVEQNGTQSIIKMLKD